jgi:hypothetical protein
MIFHKKTKRIVIINNIKYFNIYEKKYRSIGDVIFCIHPLIKRACEERKFHHVQKIDVVEEEIFQLFKKLQYEIIDKTILNLDKYSRKKTKEKKLEIGTYFSFQLWVLIGQALNCVLTIKSLTKTLNCSNYLIFEKRFAKNFLLYRPDPECIFSEIAKSEYFADTINVKIIKIDNKLNNFSSPLNLKDIIPDNFKNIIRYLKLKYSFYNKKNSDAKKLLLIGGIFDWGEIGKNDTFSKIFQIDLILPFFKFNFLKIDENINEILKNDISIDNKEIFPLNNLSKFISRDLHYYEKQYDKIHNKIKYFTAGISSVLTFPDDHFLAHMVYKTKKPFIIWQHGEKGQSDDPTIPYTELTYATNYLSFGKKVTDEYNFIKSEYKLKNVNTVGTLSKNVKHIEKKYILYATGKWHLCASPLTVLDADARLLNVQRNLLKFFESISDGKEVVFKLNNSRGLNQNVTEPNKVTVENTKSFTELLSNAACVVLDTPATTLLEAATTELPIFVVGGRADYRLDFLKAVKKRVVWEDDVDDLICKLDQYFKSNLYHSDCFNSEFRDSYCSKLPAEIVISNVINALNNAINENRY